MSAGDAFVGVDLGGTKLAAAVMRGRDLGESHVEPTRLDSSDDLLDQLTGVVQRAGGGELAAVGLGVPSIVEFETGRVVSSVNIPLRDVPLREVLGERLGVPVFVDNDATVAALAEAHDEEHHLVAHHLVMLTIGTGVGGGLVLNGRIYRGATGGAAELGHTLIGLDLTGLAPGPSGFPQPGSLEYLASGHALDRLATQAVAQAPDSELAALAAGGKPVLGAEAVRAAHDGDSAARRIVEIWAERVGIGIANAINTFDPDEVVIGGGAAQAGMLLLKPACEVAADFIVPGLGSRTNIRLARHGVGAGVLGAALLAEHEFERQRERPVAVRPQG